MDETKILLLGGDGFLGKGLQDELKARKLKFKSLDIKDCDLASADSINFCANKLEDITHVVLLASKLGATLFNNDLQAEDAYQTNKAIADNTLVALQKASVAYGRSYSLTYYSSCELFGNIPSEEAYVSLSAYNPIMSKKRYLYSKAKIDAETAFKTCCKKHPKTISDVKIVRPFNVYGKN